MSLKKLLGVLLAFSGSVMADAANDPKIIPGQNITIAIQGVPAPDMAEINSAIGYPVDHAGFIRMPHLGQIRAAGLTPSQLSASLEAAYRASEIFSRPTIQVIASAIGAKPVEELVFVAGQVTRTGGVVFTQGLTLYQAVQSAGGPTAYGAMNRVAVLRGGQNRVYNLKQIEAQKELAKPGDTITVPEKDWKGQ